MRNEPIKIITASIQGALHRSQDISCQDFWCAKKYKNKLIAVVSDGAGSAKYGKIGAKIICETICNIMLKSSFKNVEKNVLFSIETAREKLLLHRKNKEKNESCIADFSATLIGVFCYKNRGVFFHIGDGAGLAYNHKNLDDFIISEPENGAFSCETYFYTMPEWKSCLRFTYFEKLDRIILMTDGVTGFAFSDDFYKIRRKFIFPIVSYLDSDISLQSASKALENTLNDPKAQRINADDKTFLWVKLR